MASEEIAKQNRVPAVPGAPAAPVAQGVPPGIPGPPELAKSTRTAGGRDTGTALHLEP